MTIPHPHIETFSRLGAFLHQFAKRTRHDDRFLAAINRSFYDDFKNLLDKEPVQNPWFTPEFLKKAILGISSMLDPDILIRWLDRYPAVNLQQGRGRTVGLVLAGNIPLVGFHDVLCVLISGHRISAKPSSKDDRLIRKIGEIIRELDPHMGERLSFTDRHLKGIDAVIATGSDLSARYFDYYFREIPRIIRSNRNGIAVLTGEETEEELNGIGEDIFTYFGLGCRNVTKLYVPDSYDLTRFLSVMDSFRGLSQHFKYSNNVDYHRTVYLMNRIEILDNGVLILKEDKEIASPVGVVYFERYSQIEALRQQIGNRRKEIQCVVSIHPDLCGAIPPGTSQRPMPWDYADGIDTMEFLRELK